MSATFPGLDGVRTEPVRMCYMAASPPRGSLWCIYTCQLGRLVGAPCLDGRLCVHHRVERPFLPPPPSWLCIPVPACTSRCAWALFAGQPAPVTPFFQLCQPCLWVCLGQVSVFPLALQQPPRGHIVRVCPRSRQYPLLHAPLIPPSPYPPPLIHAFTPAYPPLSRPRGAGLHVRHQCFLRL